jgi:hypothetical protein
MNSFKIPLGPEIDEPHIVDEVSTTSDEFVTQCGQAFERNRRVQAQEVDSLTEIDETFCQTCKKEV